jgi:hypothetical protein
MWKPKKSLVKLLYYFTLLQLSLLTQVVFAQEDTLNINAKDSFSSRWRLEGGMLFGIGITDHEVGLTTENEKIMMSGGGGIGGILNIGYGLSPKWDISIGAGIQNSSLTPQVENASASFLRIAVMTDIKYRVPVSSSGLINFGGGLSYYFPGDLDIDITEVSGGAHNIFGYDNSIGFQFFVEYEGFFNKDFSWIIGLKYSRVTYEIKSAKSNGINIPVDDLPTDIRDEIGNLDGSSVDLVVSLNYYF